MTEESTVITARKALELLEARIVDGEDVTSTELAIELADAEATVRLAELVAKGHASRKAEKARNDHAAAIEAARQETRAMFFNFNELKMEAYDEAKAALANLVRVLSDGNDLLLTAAQRLESVGLVNGGANPDRIDSAHIAQGYEIREVTSGGSSFAPEIPGKWVRAAVQEVARANRGLPIPYQSDLEQVVSGDVPRLIADRR